MKREPLVYTRARRLTSSRARFNLHLCVVAKCVLTGIEMSKMNFKLLRSTSAGLNDSWSKRQPQWINRFWMLLRDLLQRYCTKQSPCSLVMRQLLLPPLGSCFMSVIDWLAEKEALLCPLRTPYIICLMFSVTIFFRKSNRLTLIFTRSHRHLRVLDLLAFVDPSAMMTQMREDSDFWSLPRLTTLCWRTHLVITKHPEDGHGTAQVDNTTIRLITF